jgi:hypothetical protein
LIRLDMGCQATYKAVILVGIARLALEVASQVGYPHD